jgi:hypothetical protein
MKSKTQLTKTQVKTLKQGLKGGFLPLLGAIAPALLSAIAPKAIEGLSTFGDRLFSGKNVFTGNGDVMTSPNSYILGSGANGAGRRRKKRGGASVGAGSKAGAKTNPWIAHVKAYAKKHNLSYSESIAKAKSSYQKKK